MSGEDFALTVGWGHYSTRDAVMPGQSRAVARDYTAAEREALGDAVGALGDSNVNALWSNAPAAVWNYKLGTVDVR